MKKCRLCGGKNLNLSEKGQDRYSINFECYKCVDCDLEQCESYEADESHYASVECYKDRWEFSKVLDFIRLNDGFRLVEVGCGQGFFASKLDNSSIDYTGIDFNEKALEVARKKTGGNFYNVDLHDYFESSQERIDCFCMFHVLEHLDHPIQFLSIVKENVNSGGLIVLSFPSEKRVSLFFNNREAWDYPPHHLTRWSLKSSRKLADKLNCKIILNEVEPLSWEEYLEFSAFNKKLNKIRLAILRRFVKLIFRPIEMLNYLFLKNKVSGQARLLILEKGIF